MNDKIQEWERHPKRSDLGLIGEPLHLTKREHFAFEFAKMLLRDYLSNGLSPVPVMPGYFIDKVSPRISKEATSQADELIKALNEEREG